MTWLNGRIVDYALLLPFLFRLSSSLFRLTSSVFRLPSSKH